MRGLRREASDGGWNEELLEMTQHQHFLALWSPPSVVSRWAALLAGVFGTYG